jgi:hypothetical protein
MQQEITVFGSSEVYALFVISISMVGIEPSVIRGANDQHSLGREFDPNRRC